MWVALVQKTAMHRLRTCAARLRPITASQTAKNLSQQRPAATPRTFQPFRCYTAPVAAEPFLNGTSSNYVEEMYYAWLENPKSVHKVRVRERAGGLWEEGMKRPLFQWCQWSVLLTVPNFHLYIFNTVPKKKFWAFHHNNAKNDSNASIH